MITGDVRDWLDTQDLEFNRIYNGFMGNTKQERLMLIKRGVTVSQQRAVGGLDNASYSRLACNCILHWNKDYKETEEKAKEFLDFLVGLKNPIINGHKVALMLIRNFVSIGRDENDIYEFAIDFEIIYNRL